ncbi:MAG: energy transducer TonB [Planctomycetota bacterium]
MVRRRRHYSGPGRARHAVFVVLGASAATILFFLLLPMIEAITKSSKADLTVRTVDAAALPPPPPPPPPEQKEEEKKQDDKPPELDETAPPLDLAQLELALQPGGIGNWATGDFGVKLGALATSTNQVEALFSIADLDQEPRLVYPVNPVMDAAMRRKAPGTVQIVFVVDQDGRVENPIVQSSTDPVFERAALQCVKQWRFEAGKRKGEPVRFRMRVPITFPKS